MEKVNIGKTDLKIARINLGGNVFGWTLDEKASFEILDAFVDKGFNFIDTADTYSHWVTGKEGGQSETILGKWMKSRNNRDRIVMATKVGGPTGLHPVDSSKKHILKTVEESLQRLQTDFIDLYYTHYDDGKTAVEETLEAYDELIKAGKVRYIAASNISRERLEESFRAAEKHGLPKYQALQPHYNLVERQQYEKSYAPLVEEHDLSVFPYYSLASGFLTGKYRSEQDLDKSVRGGGVKKYLTEKGLDVLSALDEVADRHNTSPATVALAWLMAQPHVDAPLASATSQKQLKTLFDAPHLKLTDEDLNVMEQASSFQSVH